jgi:UDP-N-acetylenolpyruvoylglucosamine reductase
MAKSIDQIQNSIRLKDTSPNNWKTWRKQKNHIINRENASRVDTRELDDS